MYSKTLLLLISALSVSPLFSQETIHSFRDEYYNNLSLTGRVERPYLNYKSYSTNNWKVETADHPWAEEKMDFTSLLDTSAGSFYLVDPEWFQSYNLQTPYGMNDSGLWQGKGYNTALSGGVRLESPYLDIMLAPEFYFSQNQDYEIHAPSSWSGSEWGYSNSAIDTPQRFGPDPLVYGSWGQSQIRLHYNNWTFGAGTEDVWLGPGQQSAIIWSTNASGLPHVDLGLNRTETIAGDVEFRLWWGVMKSSDYYAPDPDAYKDTITGISVSYAPVFIPGLTFGFNKTSQAKLEDWELYNLFAAVDLGLQNGMKDFGRDNFDGRASVTWSWVFVEAGFEFYGEWAREDFTSDVEGWLRKPEHADGFTLGIKQILPYRGSTKDRFFVLNTEFSSLVWSMDYYIGQGWGAGFYRHPRTNLGYAHEGQTMGAGYGTQGNLQHFELDFYAPFGMSGFYVTRIKHDDNLLYAAQSTDKNAGIRGDMLIPYNVALGFRGEMFLDYGFSLGGRAAYVFEKNWNMVLDNDFHGFNINLTAGYRY